MKIKTITDAAWNELPVKPFIFIGFYEYQSQVVAMAISDEDIYEFRIIDGEHDARQNFFSEVCRRYKGAPIALFDRKAGNFFENFLKEKSEKNTMLKIILKGPEEKLKNWQSEIENSLLKKEQTPISADNPIQCVDL
jgi:hypothetical protein